MVEFALVLPILLLVLFGIIEAALIVQGYLTVQHAAREAARFAVSYQPLQGTCVDRDGDGILQDGVDDDQDLGDPQDRALRPFCPIDFDADQNESEHAYYDRRVELIQRQAEHSATGLRIDKNCRLESFVGAKCKQDMPRFFGVNVLGVDENAVIVADYPGIRGQAVWVQIVHNVEIVDPIFSSLFRSISGNEYVQVTADAWMINEGTQVSAGLTGKSVVQRPTPKITPNYPTITPTATISGSLPPSTLEPPTTYFIDLSPDQATNYLSLRDRSHKFIATVTNQDDERVKYAPVAFSTNWGAFDFSGLELQETRNTTNDQGQAAVTIYGNYSGTATIRAWVEKDYDYEWDEIGEPLDVSSKRWVLSDTIPIILVADYVVSPLNHDWADVLNHEPGNYSLWWCYSPGPDIATTEITTKLLEIEIGAGGDVTDVGFTIPQGSKGLYHLETHQGDDGCGANTVADSADIRVKTPPNLTIAVANPVTACAGTAFTLTAAIINPTSGSTEETFDVDFYVDPASIPPWSPVGEHKQWVEGGIDPNETKGINGVLCVDSPGEHNVLAWVDTNNYVEEWDEGGHPAENDNTDVITFTLSDCGTEGQCPVQELKPPGLEICHSQLDAGGFEGRQGTVYSYWDRGGSGAYRLQSNAHSGIASMRLHASQSYYESVPACEPYSPYLSQMVQIPDETFTMTTVHVRGWRLVDNSETDCSYKAPHELAGPEADDGLYLQMKDGSGANLGTLQEIVNGGGGAGWKAFEQDVTDVVNPYERAGETVQIYFSSPYDDNPGDGIDGHDGDGTDTWFYLDDLECEVCTKWSKPPLDPTKVSIGGKALVFISGWWTERQWVDVWAFGQEGGSYHTVTIQDGSYHFYNIPPGTYRIYAEAWIGERGQPGSILRYSHPLTVRANTPDVDIDDVNLFLY